MDLVIRESSGGVTKERREKNKRYNSVIYVIVGFYLEYRISSAGWTEDITNIGN